VTPLKPGATFTFHLDFRNLLESELALLFYALELEPAQQLVQASGSTVVFDWTRVRDYPGIYPKLGYGKPAGLGSVCILVTELALLDSAARYGGQGDGWHRRFVGTTLRTSVEGLKGRFRNSQIYTRDDKRYYQLNLADLRSILRFPNGIGSFRYPTLREFRDYKERAIKLPMPGQEHRWGRN
jgi:hypothetical protein